MPHQDRSEGPAAARSTPGWARRDGLALAAVVLVCVALFSGYLGARSGVTPGIPTGDAPTEWAPAREFGFGWLRRGVVARWNPHILCGTPFLANWQSALFYPPNGLFMALPLHWAARLTLLAHMCLGAAGAYLLARRLDIGPAGAAAAALAFALAAPQSLRVYAGHWGAVCAQAWMPLVLLATESLIRRPTLGRALLGGLSVAMQLLAGAPQYAAYTWILCAAYAAFRLLWALPEETSASPGLPGASDSPWRGGGASGHPERSEAKPRNLSARCAAPAKQRVAPASPGTATRRVARTLAFGAAMGAFGVMLAAPQVVPALAAAPLLARAGDVRLTWAAAFSFQPENLVTFIAPGFFGDDARQVYWGFFNLWEMCAYQGCVTLVFAAAGTVLRRDRRRWALVAGATLMLLLALGKHVPPLYALYTGLPGAGMLRGTAKFLSPFSLLAALLAGMGVEALARVSPRGARRIIAGCFAAGLLVAGGAFLLDARPQLWDELVRSVITRGERFGLMRGESERALARRDAGANLLRAAGLFGLCGGLLLVRRRGKERQEGATRSDRVPGVALAALLLVDLATFNWEYFDPKHGFDASDAALRGDALEIVRREGAGGRVWVRADRRLNDPMRLQLHAVEGVEPNPPLAFHQLFALAVRKPPDIAPSIYQITRDSPLWRLMAVRVVAQPAAMGDRAPGWEQIGRAGRTTVYRVPDALPRAFVVSEYATGALDPAQIEAFPYAERVWLPDGPTAVAEEREDVALTLTSRSAGGNGAAQIVSEAPNRLEIEAELSAPGWLVLSDTYFPGWRAEADGRPAPILRANYAFRALHLGEGRHRVVFRFHPEGLDSGFVLCGTAVALGLGLLLARCSARRRRGRSVERGGAADTPSR